MSTILRWLTGFGRFWYGFIVGDDWTVAATVAVALVVTWLLHTARWTRGGCRRWPRWAQSG